MRTSYWRLLSPKARKQTKTYKSLYSSAPANIRCGSNSCVKHPMHATSRPLGAKTLRSSYALRRGHVWWKDHFVSTIKIAAGESF